MNVLTQLYNYTLDILSPPFCTTCKGALSKRFPLCVTCLEKVHPIVSKTIPINKQYSLTVHALSDYQDPLRHFILGKHSYNIVLSYQLGILMAHQFPSCLFSTQVLVPIPLHWTRYAWRGFNQAYVFSKVIGNRHNIPVNQILKRIRQTQFQASLHVPERIQNIHNAFHLLPHAQNYQSKHIVLIDDLMTTGTTLYEAAKTLTILNPLSISAFVACRVQ